MATSSSSSTFIILIFLLFWAISALDASPSSSSSSSYQSNVQFNFNGFSLTDVSYFNFTQYSNIQFTALQVTYDTGSRDVAILNASGQITYNTPLHLWDTEYNYTASFNTSFLINMGPTQDNGTNISGGGMAFILSSNPAQDVPNSYGSGLGLIDPSNHSSPTNASRFVAIEFDTFYDPGIDPYNANHVGIDVDTVKSVVTQDLDAYNITLNQNLVNMGTNTCVWIDYDGHAKAFDIYLANQASGSPVPKPEVPVISQYQLELNEILPDTVHLGFSASTGTIKETHCVLQWKFNSTAFPKEINKPLIIGLSVGLSIALLLIGSMVTLCIIKQRKVQPDLLEDLRGLNYGPRRFSYRELKKATGGFSEENKLGEGGFGSVYRGKLASSINTEIAVKRLSSKSTQGKREFKAEIRSMGRMRHKNLVQLLGWSYDNWNRKLVLVYEYMPNGSLDRWLSAGGSTDPQSFSWERRFNVLRGVAAGLLYLHEEWEMVVIHRDLKPSNVMLDADFNARLGDFGLAKLIRNPNPNPNPDGHAQSIHTTSMAGTYGYMAPECMENGAITKESDVYSFGVMAIEVVRGNRFSAQILDRLRKVKEEGANILSSEFAEESGICYSSHGSLERQQMEMVLEMSLACCHLDPSCRPKVREIVHALSFSANANANANADDGLEYIRRYFICFSAACTRPPAPASPSYYYPALNSSLSGLE